MTATTSKITTLDRASMPTVFAAIDRLKEDQEPQWGTMRPHLLLRHLRTGIEAAFEEVEGLPDMSNVLTRSRLVRELMFAFPIPRGKFKAPEALTPEPEFEFVGEKEALKETVERFVNELERNPDRLGWSFMLGKIPFSDWSRLNGMHFQHHFEQFDLLR